MILRPMCDVMTVISKMLIQLVVNFQQSSMAYSKPTALRGRQRCKLGNKRWYPASILFVWCKRMLVRLIPRVCSISGIIVHVLTSCRARSLFNV